MTTEHDFDRSRIHTFEPAFDTELAAVGAPQPWTSGLLHRKATRDGNGRCRGCRGRCRCSVGVVGKVAAHHVDAEVRVVARGGSVPSRTGDFDELEAFARLTVTSPSGEDAIGQWLPSTISSAPIRSHRNQISTSAMS